MATSIPTEYLGQIVPAPAANPLTKDALNIAKGTKLQLFVASENKLKIESAKNAAMLWLEGYTIEAKGFNAASKIHEQPVGEEETKQGAKNRITHLKELAKADVRDDAVQIYVSMENGLIPEEIKDVKNPGTFLDTTIAKTWVDRCFVIVELFNQGKAYEGFGISRGVTTPVDAVHAAEDTKWNSTAGSFIEHIYKFSAKDWHGKMAGVGRQELMQETISAALGTK